jgi:hypothetical protein
MGIFQMEWCTSVVPAPWEAEARRIIGVQEFEAISYNVVRLCLKTKTRPEKAIIGSTS